MHRMGMHTESMRKHPPAVNIMRQRHNLLRQQKFAFILFSSFPRKETSDGT